MSVFEPQAVTFPSRLPGHRQKSSFCMELRVLVRIRWETTQLGKGRGLPAVSEQVMRTVRLSFAVCAFQWDAVGLDGSWMRLDVQAVTPRPAHAHPHPRFNTPVSLCIHRGISYEPHVRCRLIDDVRSWSFQPWTAFKDSIRARQLFSVQLVG